MNAIASRVFVFFLTTLIASSLWAGSSWDLTMDDLMKVPMTERKPEHVAQWINLHLQNVPNVRQAILTVNAINMKRISWEGQTTDTQEPCHVIFYVYPKAHTFAVVVAPNATLIKEMSEKPNHQKVLNLGFKSKVEGYFGAFEVNGKSGWTAEAVQVSDSHWSPQHLVAKGISVFSRTEQNHDGKIVERAARGVRSTLTLDFESFDTPEVLVGASIRDEIRRITYECRFYGGPVPNTTTWASN